MEKREIEATLKNGKLMSKKFKYFLIIVSFFLVLLLISVVVVAFIYSHYEKDKKFIISLIILIIFMSSIYLPISFYVLFFEYKRKREVDLWLNDIIEITAVFNLKYDYQPSIWSGNYKLEATFCFEGKMKTLCSQSSNLIFKKYANKTLNVLYSPKYEQILFVKQ